MKTSTLQKKSHEVLLKLLNNIGIVGAILAAIADIAFVLIMVLGVQINVQTNAIVIFAIVNALIGILINILLRYQGKKYAEIENDELCKKFYNKKVREKKHLTIGKWMALKTAEDFVIKGAAAAFSIFGIIYISIQGSKNPIQILITIATLILFACFGLISMNSAYERFYNIQVPYMKLEIEKREQKAKKSKVTTTDPCVSLRKSTKIKSKKVKVEQIPTETIPVENSPENQGKNKEIEENNINDNDRQQTVQES